MDNGAHFYNCDFQVHTPRDKAWIGPAAVTEDDRTAYAHKFVQACRDKNINAVAITDHHCMTFIPYIRRAANEETGSDGSELTSIDRLTIFPGMELTLGVPCQVLLVFDADFPNDMFSLAMTALAITQSDHSQSKVQDVVRLDGITTISALKLKLDEHSYLKGKYIILPNLTDEGKHSLLRKGQTGKYAEMPSVGGYSDGQFSKLSEGTKNILAGRDKAWGHKKVACIQTSDSRRDDHIALGKPSTWIKWATPTAEALRQACLAQESRISLDIPQVPETFIASISVNNSSFLGPLDLNLNPQYNALIGGRGTGKSTLLEYCRWALCDQTTIDVDDAPNYQARRMRLIDVTLRPLNAVVQVNYVLNNVNHIVRRSSEDGSLKMKIGAGEMQSCTEEEVRALLPIQAYSQKQLSDVSVRVDELTRFITAPIKTKLNLLNRKAADLANRIRENYATRQRFRDLSKILNNRILEEKSVTEQVNSIRTSLTGLSEDDRRLLDRGKLFSDAESIVGGWRAGVSTFEQKTKELLQIAKSQLNNLPQAPEQPAELNDNLKNARNAYASLLDSAIKDLERIILAAGEISNPTSDGPNIWTEWENGNSNFRLRYVDAVQRSSSNIDKLNQLKTLEAKINDLSVETTRTREVLATLSTSDESYLAARTEWLSALAEYDDLIDNECAELTKRSAGSIRVQMERYADCKTFISVLRQGVAGSRIQSTKLESLGSAIVSSDNPKTLWIAVLDELEALAAFDPEGSHSESRPAIKALAECGISASDAEKIATSLKPEDWLVLALTPIESIPVYEFKTAEGEYIPFENASAGQQATALLKTLLNQPGPPLIVDQPEEDLDNPVMLEIVEQLWEAKKLRQIVFASHNANLVVNGDAELVAWFGYRTAGDQSRGTIRGTGAIDIEAAREAIKQIMEGGEAAFRLRREKYGF